MKRVLTAAIMIVATVTVAPATARGAASALPPYCGLSGFDGMHTFVWTGAAHDHKWVTALNWDASATSLPASHAPGYTGSDSANSDYACIPSGSTVRLNGNSPNGEYAHLAALDVNTRARVVLVRGAHLFLNRHSAAQPSVLRHGGSIAINGATIGGTGTLIVRGTLHLTAIHGDPDPVNNSASTVASRQCDEGQAQCSAGATQHPGRIAIYRGGTVTVDGTDNGGVNLEDRYVIDNAGTLSLANEGYLAADNGTAIVNESDGRIDIRDNGGIYQGRFPRYGAGRATLTNSGVLAKSGGHGVSVIGVTYRPRSGGSIAVSSGSLTIGGSTAPRARVAPGRTYGTGQCRPANPNASSCSTIVSSGQPRATAVQLPRGFSRAGHVTITPASSHGAPTGSLPRRVQQITTPGAQRSPERPMRFVFTFRRKSYPSLAGTGWRHVKVFRSDTTAYTRVRSCLPNGRPRGSLPSCVDLRSYSQHPGASHATSSTVRIVVRTTQNSRWVIV